MSMVPLIFRDWWDDFDLGRTSRLLDQNFGTQLSRDDLLDSFSTSLRSRPSILSRYYNRPWRSSIARQDSGSTINNDKEKFQIILDVQQFAPDEITVKTTGNSIVVEGKHNEKQDEHGFVARHFVRRYVLPEDHDINDVISSLSSDGVLTVTAPKQQAKQTGERVVPIMQTGPAKATVTPLVEEK